MPRLLSVLGEVCEYSARDGLPMRIFCRREKCGSFGGGRADRRPGAERPRRFGMAQAICGRQGRLNFARIGGWPQLHWRDVSNYSWWLGEQDVCSFEWTRRRLDGFAFSDDVF